MAVKTITIGEIKPRLAELEEKFASGEPDWEVEENSDDTELSDDWEELLALQDLRHALDWCWHDDSTALLRSADFTEFAMDLLYATGDLRKGGIADGIIDCDKAAECIEQGYMLVTYDQEDYMVRN